MGWGKNKKQETISEVAVVIQVKAVTVRSTLQLGMYSASESRRSLPSTPQWSKSGNRVRTTAALCHGTWKDGGTKVGDCRQHSLNNKWESYLM